MTSLRYSRTDCAGKSQVRGIAPSSNAWRLRQRFHLRFPWLQQVCVPSHFNYRLEGRTINVEIK